MVRIRLADAAPGRRFRDVTGELIEIDAERLRVLSSAGAAVTVPAADVVAAKEIPPRPTPNSEILRLERSLAASWPAVESTERFGWLLRYSEGFSRRGNSVLALTVPDVPLSEAIEGVERWYAERGASALVAVPGRLGKRLDAEFEARGWGREAETAVLTRPVEAIDYRGEAVIVHEPSPEMLDQVGRGMPGAAAKVLGSGPARAYAEIRRDGKLVARGRGAIEDGIAAVATIGTLPEYRRRGLGTQILDALLAWAAVAGAEWVALQVEADNEPALAIYTRLGFNERYRYWYRRRPDTP